jgi:ABC-2 type transport system permease protein
MLKHNFKYEWKQLMRDRWVVMLLIIFVALCLFAAANGKRKMETHQSEIAESIRLMNKADEGHKAMIDSVDLGLKKNLEPWLNPKKLSFVGNRAARVAAMPAKPISFIATGQSDLYSHSVKPTLYGEAYLLGFSELSNPVQLMFGSFDLAFVIIYLLPLLVLGFSYNLLSSEKEQGSLRLTIAQPISLYQWLFSKMLLRFLIMTAIVWISLLGAMSINGISVFDQFTEILQVLLLITAYIFFWFLVALIVNSFGRSSGSNAIAMISIWVGLVLLLPAIISQLANNIYPVPSRMNMIHEMRMAQAEAEKKADDILDGFYRDHPELAQRDTLAQNQYQFYLKYFASQDIVRKAIRPVIDDYQSKLKAQQDWVDALRFISPSLVLQNSFNNIAGTSSQHYTAYREQVIQFAESWRSYFLPRMFRNESMKKEDFASLPSFEFQYGEVKSTLLADSLALLIFISGLTAISVWTYRKESLEQILT